MVSSLARFTMWWCCSAAAYVVVLGLFKLATKEACDKDYGLFQVRFEKMLAAAVLYVQLRCFYRFYCRTRDTQPSSTANEARARSSELLGARLSHASADAL